MKVFVAGRSGQVARALAECNGVNGHKVRCFGRPEFDLNDANGIRNIVRNEDCDLVINACLLYTSPSPRDS